MTGFTPTLKGPLPKCTGEPLGIRLFSSSTVLNTDSLLELYDSSGEISAQKQKKKVAGVTGLEPATSGVTGQRSNQLSYTPATFP